MKSRLALMALIFWAAALTLTAQSIDLSGNVEWFQSGSRIRIEAGRVSNFSGATTGPLRLQIWATTTPYDGVSNIEGFVIGSALLPRMRTDREFVNIVKRARYRRPPANYYYTTITLEEKRDGIWYIVDSENFKDLEGNPSLVNLGGYAEGAVDLESNGQNNLTFFGTVSFFVGNGRAELSGAAANERASGASGSMRVRLFASTNGYSPDKIFYAYPLATKRIGRISAQSQKEFFTSRASYRPPPPGYWFITVALEEYNRGWEIVDYYNFQDARLF